MAVSGLLVTLADDAHERALALSALADEPRVTLGPRAGARLALLAETPSIPEDEALFEALRALRGVAHVDLVYVEELPPGADTELVSEEEVRAQAAWMAEDAARAHRAGEPPATDLVQLTPRTPHGSQP